MSVQITLVWYYTVCIYICIYNNIIIINMNMYKHTNVTHVLTQMFQAIVSDRDTRRINGFQSDTVPGLCRHAVVISSPRFVGSKLDRATKTKYPLCCSSVRTHVGNTAVVNSVQNNELYLYVHYISV